MAEYKNRAALEQEVEALKAQLAEKTEAVEVAPVEIPAEAAPEAPKNAMPVPTDWEDAVHSILNKKFTVEVDYNADTPTFGFSILVPKEYSNASKPHWDTYHEDRRTRVIDNAQGAGGVKQWVERVYNNFDNETKAKITSDRNAE